MRCILRDCKSKEPLKFVKDETKNEKFPDNYCNLKFRIKRHFDIHYRGNPEGNKIMKLL